MSVNWRDLYSNTTELGVYCRTDHDVDVFAYRDLSEEYLLEKFRSLTDLSMGSVELIPLIKDWASEYHLSDARANLLRPFEFEKGKRLLEIGCGCGAITRQFGEMGLEVCALEGSLARAKVARERCRDLSNVSVFCDNFNDFPAKGAFDLVTLIGVLEYAPTYFGGDNPVQGMLSRAREMLAPGGTLIIAIENRLGLKYFAGHEEDHVGIPYWGIQNLYRPKAAITYGRRQLEELVLNSGFQKVNFFYPFPDYKIPNLVVSESGVLDKDFSPADIIAGHGSRSYNSPVETPFDESLVWSSLGDNALLPELSNSFLVFCSVDQDSNSFGSEWLARQYSINRIHRIVTQTTFARNGAGGIEVAKEVLTPQRDGLIASHLPHSERYERGCNLIQKIKRIFASESSQEPVKEVLQPWIDYLLSSRVVATGQIHQWRLPTNFVDCVPHNLIVVEDGSVRYIDREWKWPESVEFSWIFIRGIMVMFGKCFTYGPYEGLKVKDAVRELGMLFGFRLTSTDIARALELERQLVCGKPGTVPDDELIFLEQFANAQLKNMFQISRAEDRRVNVESDQVNEELPNTGNAMKKEIDGEIEECSKLAALLQQKLRKITEYEFLLDQRSKQIREKSQEIAEKSKEIERKEEIIKALQDSQQLHSARIAALEDLNHRIMNSKGWKGLNLIRNLKQRVRGAA